jgi:hypothetical protein
MGGVKQDDVVRRMYIEALCENQKEKVTRKTQT